VRKLLILLAIVGILAPLNAPSARAQTTIKCGDIIEGEFMKESEIFIYKLSLLPGDSVFLSVTPFGDTLEVAVALYTPTGKFLKEATGVGPYAIPTRRPELDSGVLGGRGEYSIAVANAEILNLAATTFSQAGSGPFTLNVSCILKDGTIINPGDAVKSTPAPSDNAPVAPATIGSSLPLPVAEGAVSLPLTLAQPITVAVAPTITYSSVVKANAGDQYKVEITRQSGTAPLGIAVYDPAKTPIFALAMGSSSTFSAVIETPTAGEYTFVYNLAPLSGAAAAQAGVYQVTISKAP
jgi:hypothetical protein